MQYKFWHGYIAFLANIRVRIIVILHTPLDYYRSPQIEYVFR